MKLIARITGHSGSNPLARDTESAVVLRDDRLPSVDELQVDSLRRDVDGGFWAIKAQKV